MKKIVCLLLCCCCLTIPAIKPVAAQGAISVTLNGQALNFDQPPINVNDRVLVPLRGVLEAMGAAVFWEAGVAYAVTKQDCVTLTNLEINRNEPGYELRKNHQQIAMDVQPALIHDRLLVPVRVMSEAFGLLVDWDAATDTVLLEGSIPPELRLSPEEILAANEYTLEDSLQVLDTLELVPLGGELIVDFSAGEKCYSHYVWPKEAAAVNDDTQIVFVDVFADGRIVTYQN